jgi:hypothetical protein
MKLTEKKTHKAKNKRREGRGAGRVKNLVIINRDIKGPRIGSGYLTDFQF